MKIQGQFEWTDYLDAQLLHLKPSLLGTIFLYGYVGMAVLSLVVGAIRAFRGNADFMIYISPVVALAAVIVLVRFVYLPRQTKKVFLQQKSLHSPFEIDLTESSLNTSTDIGHSEFPWKNFVKWKEDKKMLLAYHSDVMFQIFPKRIYTNEQMDLIRTKLKENNISVAGYSSPAHTVRNVAVVLLIIVAIVVFLFQFRVPTR